VRAGRVVARVETGTRSAVALAAGGDRLVLVDAGGPRLVSVSIHGGRTAAARLPVGEGLFGDRYEVAAGAGVAWVAQSGGVVIPLRADGRGAFRPIRVGGVPTEVAVGRDAVWVVDLWRRRVLRIDPARMRVLGTAHLMGRASATGLQLTPGAVWVLETDGTLVRVDPASGRSLRSSRPLGGPPQTRALAAGGGRLWAASYFDRLLVEIDATSGRRVGAPLRLPFQPTHLAVGAGGVWVADQGGRVARVDPASHRVVGGLIRAGRAPVLTRGLAVSDGALWLADGATGRVIRIEV
jgi:streptogramin lyase